jgi:chromosome segregation ATPase
MEELTAQLNDAKLLHSQAVADAERDSEAHNQALAAARRDIEAVSVQLDEAKLLHSQAEVNCRGLEQQHEARSAELSHVQARCQDLESQLASAGVAVQEAQITQS